MSQTTCAIRPGLGLVGTLLPVPSQELERPTRSIVAGRYEPVISAAKEPAQSTRARAEQVEYDGILRRAIWLLMEGRRRGRLAEPTSQSAGFAADTE